MMPTNVAARMTLAADPGSLHGAVAAGVNPIGPRGVYDEAKRYAEALTMAYHRQQGVDPRIARISTRSSPTSRCCSTTAVSCGVRRSQSRGAALGDGSRRRLCLADCDCLRAVAPTRSSIRSTASPCPLSATAAASSPRRRRAHRASADRPCFEVRTRYGRSIRVTGDHSLFVEGRTASRAARGRTARTRRSRRHRRAASTCPNVTAPR